MQHTITRKKYHSKTQEEMNERKKIINDITMEIEKLNTVVEEKEGELEWWKARNIDEMLLKR